MIAAAEIEDLLQRAREAESAGRIADALNLFEQAAAAAPRRKSVIVESTSRLLAHGRSDVALRFLRDAIELFPASGDITTRLARALAALGDFDEAATLARRLAHRMESAGAYLDWARLANKAGRPEEAREALDLAMVHGPKDVRVLIAYGDLLETMGNLAEAEGFYRRAIQARPDEPTGYVRLARLMLVTERLDKAEAVLRWSIKQNPTFVTAYINLAAVYLKKHQFTDALAAIDAGLAIWPEVPEGQLTRGMILLEMGDLPAALVCFDETLRREPNEARALLGRAMALGRSGEHAQAVESLDRLLQIDPDNAQARHFRAAWSGTRDDEQAIAYARELFDGAANYFDKHLVEALRYGAPRDLAALLRHVVRRRDAFRALCDVGCGTGLVAAALEEHFNIPRRAGIDVSGKMIEIARSKGLYSELYVGDAASIVPTLSGQFDLITAMDVFIYVPHVEDLIRALASKLPPDGLLAFSIEVNEAAAGSVLTGSGRFQHSPRYIGGVVDRVGLRRMETMDIVLRHELREPQKGQIWLVRRPSA